MYVAPNTNIRLLSNVPLDNTYEHSIYFANQTAQINYFMGKTKRNLTNQSFQRTNRGYARVQVPVNDIYDCNYMMFQNTSFGNKWFYAFITSMEYINNEVTEIQFEIDVLQTWYFDYDLGECYIERQHTPTDVIGGNIVPEPVALGEYTLNTYNELEWVSVAGTSPPNGRLLSNLCVLIAIVDVNASASEGIVYDRIYSGAKIYAFNLDDVTGINNKLSEYIQKPDSILAMYMCPATCVKERIETGGTLLPTNTTGAAPLSNADRLLGTEPLDGYTPRNKKLYTYPYNFYQVDNGAGNSLALRYEFFTNRQPVFRLLSTITQPVQASIRPYQYKNISGIINTESLELASYPMCSWNVDTYKAWAAQNSVPLAISMTSGIVQAALSGDVKNVVGNVLGSITNIMQQNYTASIQADMCKGNQNNGGVNSAAGRQAFYGARVSITGDMAARIDNFFDYFGYQINKLQVPNRNARRYWTYLKTATCVLTGSVPNDDSSKIVQIYNQGITWWNNGDNIGDYSLDNTV